MYYMCLYVSVNLCSSLITKLYNKSYSHNNSKTVTHILKGEHYRTGMFIYISGPQRKHFNWVHYFYTVT